MNYNEMEGLRQSNLKKLLISPKSYLSALKKQENIDEDDETEEHFVFGSVLDLMLKDKKEEFGKKYLRVPDNISISANIKNIITGIYKEVKGEEEIKELKEYKSHIIKYAKKEGYGQTWKEETVVNKVIEAASEGFEWLRKLNKKTGIKESDFQRAINCKSALMADPYTKKFIDSSLSPNVEFIDDFVTVFTYKGEKIKVELDRVVINHITKEIYPIDFKFTSKPIYNFERDFWFYRYDFQAATYKAALYQDDRITKLLKEGYFMKDFLYIVVEKLLIHNPIIFKVTNEVSLIGLQGGTLSNGTKLEGLDQALEKYTFHTKNNKWEYPMEYYQNKGICNITV